MSKFICNLLIPGAGKSGTSSLHTMLGRHPNINMSNEKEPQFFSFEDIYKKGASFHNSLFDEGDEYEYYGESSQSYFFHEHAIERIKRDLDSPRIILLLRHPVARLISHYRWHYKHGLENRPFMQAIQEGGHGYILRV